MYSSQHNRCHPVSWMTRLGTTAAEATWLGRRTLHDQIAAHDAHPGCWLINTKLDIAAKKDFTHPIQDVTSGPDHTCRVASPSTILKSQINQQQWKFIHLHTETPATSPNQHIRPQLEMRWIAQKPNATNEHQTKISLPSPVSGFDGFSLANIRTVPPSQQSPVKSSTTLPSVTNSTRKIHYLPPQRNQQRWISKMILSVQFKFDEC